jgi:hypothetical protein
MSENTDLLGWQQTRWGMTDEEIVASVGVQQLRRTARSTSTNVYHELIIPSVDVGRYPYDVQFQMSNSTNRLIQVLLKHDAEELSSLPTRQLDSARKLLSEKFGPPRRDGTSEDWVWAFPSTTIMLQTFFIEEIVSSAIIRFFAPGEMPGPQEVSAF